MKNKNKNDNAREEIYKVPEDEHKYSIEHEEKPEISIENNKLKTNRESNPLPIEDNTESKSPFESEQND